MGDKLIDMKTSMDHPSFSSQTIVPKPGHTGKWEHVNLTTHDDSIRRVESYREKIYKFATRDWSWKFYTTLAVFIAIYTLTIALLTLDIKIDAFVLSASTYTKSSPVNPAKLPTFTGANPPAFQTVSVHASGTAPQHHNQTLSNQAHLPPPSFPDSQCETITISKTPNNLLKECKVHSQSTKTLKVMSMGITKNLKSLLEKYPNVESLTLDFRDFCPNSSGKGIILKFLSRLNIRNTRDCKIGFEASLNIRAPVLQELHLENIILDKSLYESKVARFMFESCHSKLPTLSKVFLSNVDICNECLFGHDICPSVSYRKFTSYNIL